MNCNKHFDFQQFFNGKLCCKIHDLLSVQIIFFWIGLLDAISSICYICVAPMKLCPLMWHRVWLICNIKGCFHLTMIFNKRWLSSLFNGLIWLQPISWCISLGSGLSILVWTVVSLLQGGFCVIIGCWGKLFGCFKGNFENTGQMEIFSMPGESDLVDSFMFWQGQIQIPSLACLFESVIWNDNNDRGKVR